MLLSSQASATVINRIVATIDGDPITLHELEQFEERNAQLRQLPALDREMTLDALITERLIEKEVAGKGIVIQPEDVERYIQSIRQRNRLTEEQLATVLEQQGLDMEAYRAQVRGELQKVQLINREIRGKLNITPEDVERYYEAHLEDYETDPSVGVSQILIVARGDASDSAVEEAMQRARHLHEQLEDGADFAELAREHSEGPAAEEGGRLGSFRPGELMGELDDVVEGLDEGEFSEPVRTRLGVHIVRVDERTEGGHVPLEEVAEQIEEKLYGPALEERYAEWLTEGLREAHHVVVLGD